jgi:5-methylcytosine-specific restriction endonuclease McrA
MKLDPLNSHPPSNALLVAIAASNSSGRGWSESCHDNMKVLLKDYLLDLQECRCFYCQCDIKDVLGFLEIDHILPKAPRGDPALWTSNDRTRRRRTAGYPQYEFSFYNFVLTCKRCNNRKGSYDARKVRANQAPAIYNLDSNYFEWIHPYLDIYEDHISRLEGLIYQAVNSSPKGGAVIYACRLDKIEAAERAVRNRKVKRNRNYKDAISDLLAEHGAIGWSGLADLVVQHFPHHEAEIRAFVGQLEALFNTRKP